MDYKYKYYTAVYKFPKFFKTQPRNKLELIERTNIVTHHNQNEIFHFFFKA